MLYDKIEVETEKDIKSKLRIQLCNIEHISDLFEPALGYQKDTILQTHQKLKEIMSIENFVVLWKGYDDNIFAYIDETEIHEELPILTRECRAEIYDILCRLSKNTHIELGIIVKFKDDSYLQLAKVMGVI